MMLHLLHQLIVVVYVALPPAAVAAAVVRRRRGALAGILLTFLMGMTIGAALSVVFAAAVGGRVPLLQMALAGYFTTSLLLLLKLFDRGLRWGTRAALRTGAKDAPRRRLRAADTLRAALLFGLGLPYVIAAAATYRPRLTPPASAPPPELSGEPAAFTTSDGIHIAGIWSAAAAPPPRLSPAESARWGRDTIIFCRGSGADDLGRSALAELLAASGYNVLRFDFRAHGASGGRMTTFGDLERFDVLAAVQWARATHPQGCHRVLGVGMGTGGAALLAAAADDSPEGRAIDAIAVYDTYDRFEALAADVTGAYFLPPLNWLALHVSLPMASAQTGVHLGAFSPADLTLRVAPRPILVIHARNDRIIPFERGVQLFEAALAPKQSLWLDNADAPEAANSADAADMVRWFFEHAVPMT